MSTKDVEKEHADYAKYKRECALVEIMQDEHELKRSCIQSSGGEDSYLKKPLSHKRPKDPEKEKQLYERYVEHAMLPDHIVTDSLEEMIGICFKATPNIALPDRIQYLETHANARGDSLQAVAEQAIRDVLSTRKSCIVTDYTDKAIIQVKQSKGLINWRKNSHGYQMMVMSETYTDDDGKEKEQRRHYEVVNNVLIVTVYRKSAEGKWAEHIELDENGNAVPQPSLPNNKPFDYIPIRVPETPKPPLLGMARTVWKGFRISADYYGMLHTLTPTLVIKSDKSAEALSVGYENGLKLGQDDSAELLQQGVDGADPLRVAMETQFNSAIDQGVRLITSATSGESGEALYLRNANKQIKIDAVARMVSDAITEALRVAAILENANPDDVSFKLQVELVEAPVDVDRLKELREAVVDSQLVRHRDYLLQLHANNLIELTKKPDGTLDTDEYISEVTKEFAEINAARESL